MPLPGQWQAGPVPMAVPESVPSAVPVDVPVIEPASTPTVPVPVPRTVAPGRARARAPKSRQASPERIFAAEIDRGELPSLRAIKTRLHVGTDRARAVRDELAQILEEVPEAA